MVAVHPHWRGEHISFLPDLPRQYGSSPLAWGTWFILCEVGDDLRFIPTGVGNMWTSGTFKFGGAVHPHWRGEHAAIVIDTLARNGSSPLAWGTCHNGRKCCGCPRFIPTGVGNMLIPHLMLLLVTVHPHWRGEHTQSRERYPPDNGSSPLAWGTYVNGADVSTVVRFIPTGVGNIYKRYANLDDDAVHPHWRGEHITMIARKPPLIGSSPLAWGTFYTLHAYRPGARFIPTGVGNMEQVQSDTPHRAVHPHWRGEHTNYHSFLVDLNGSSPLAWGTFLFRFIPPPLDRFIPTGVGNMWEPWTENHYIAGSSPLAWGTCIYPT